MTKFTTIFLFVTLLLSGKVAWAGESNEHKKNISNAVSAQLLRMKLKKMGKIKANKKEKSLAKTSKLKAKNSKPDEEVQQNKTKSTVNANIAIDTKPLAPVIKKEAIKIKQDTERQKKQLKADKKPLTSQNKNDNLRLKLQDLVNSAAD
ncbi:MAG: hypothetical protein KAG34_03400 [Cocleimonas sp.]|nr:hypothetical protein [Cocleimonas sp.]